MKVGINASRARSGGAAAHIIGILNNPDLRGTGIDEIHVWTHVDMATRLPSAPWLVVHTPPELERALPHQMLWERFALPRELKARQCDILLNVDAGSVCRFRPAVTMSRDMLSYEPGEMERFGWGKARLRLILLRYVQNSSFRAANGVIFLTKYASEVIQRSCGALRSVAVIPHGVGEAFASVPARHEEAKLETGPLRCLYVSNALPYKHQWHVVDAVARLRAKGFDVRLELVGGGDGPAQERLERQIAESDGRGEFVVQRQFVAQAELPGYLAEADLFVFASSCENMPNTLIEAMAAGVPIACSNRGPMPEVLNDGGLYFDPETPEEIAAALERLILDVSLRVQLAQRARELSRQYSWERCARETFAYVQHTATTLQN